MYRFKIFLIMLFKRNYFYLPNFKQFVFIFGLWFRYISYKSRNIFKLMSNCLTSKWSIQLNYIQIFCISSKYAKCQNFLVPGFSITKIAHFLYWLKIKEFKMWKTSFMYPFKQVRGCHHHDHMVVGFTSTCAISAYHHYSCEMESRSWQGVFDTTLCDKVCQ
jgi:hypothetical protein